jgi:hypothetical protein
MPLHGGLSVERMCQLAQVSRAGFYRYVQCRWQGEEEVAVRSAVQSVVIDHRWRYGSVASRRRVDRIGAFWSCLSMPVTKVSRRLWTEAVVQTTATSE